MIENIRNYNILPITKTNAVIDTSAVCSGIQWLTCSRSHMVVTGGDDNALGITTYNLGDVSKPITSRFLLRSAHAAAITGLCIIGGKETRILTTGNDQRVRAWNLRMNSDGRAVVEIEKAGDVFTSIADVGDMAALTHEKILVVGNGMEVWSVEARALS